MMKRSSLWVALLIIGALTAGGAHNHSQRKGHSPAGGFSNIKGTGQLVTTSSKVREQAGTGDELLAPNGWTSDGWTGTNPFSHELGNVSSLSNSFVPEIGSLYVVTYIVTNRATGSFRISLGGKTANNGRGGSSDLDFTESGAFGPCAEKSAPLTITPSKDFDGTITLSVKRVYQYEPVWTINDSDSQPTVEIRSSPSYWFNTLFGVNAGLNMVNPTNNPLFYGAAYDTFYGSGAGYQTTTGWQNTFIGGWAGRDNTTGSYNAFVGAGAGQVSRDSNWCTFFGTDSALHHLTGDSNAFFGTSSGAEDISGTKNSYHGHDSGTMNETGSENTAMGWASLFNNKASENTAFGSRALYHNKTGERNVANGYFSLYANAEGSSNVASGAYSAHNNTTGNYNTALGYGAGSDNETGSSNVTLGAYAGKYNLQSNYFFLNNIDQGNSEKESAHSLLVGHFSGTAKSLSGQWLKCNGAFSANSIDGPVGTIAPAPVTSTAFNGPLGTARPESVSATTINASGPAAIGSESGINKFSGHNRFVNDSVTTERFLDGDNEAGVFSLAGAAPGYANCSISQSDIVAHGGTHSAKLTPSGDAGSSMTYYVAGEQMPVYSMGSRWVLSCWIYIPSSSKATAAYWSVVTNNEHHVGAPHWTLKKDKWVQCTLDFVLPTNYTAGSWYLALKVDGDTSSAENIVYFDDVSLIEYSGGNTYTGGDVIAAGKFTGGGSASEGSRGLKIDTAGNGTIDGSLTVAQGFFPRQINADPMSGGGTEGELVYNKVLHKLYVCTATDAANATWEPLN
jgi:hypothetical protein